MAISNQALSAKLDRIEALLVAIHAQGGTVATVASAPTVAAATAVETVARPYFASTGATLRTLSEAGDIAAIAEVAFRAAKRAAK
jgi:hypothetical protein